mgnify:CR=1 FL=1
MANYDFRILIDTISGSQYSYGTGSFVNVANDTSFLLTTSGAAAIIDNMRKIQYFDAKTHNTSSFENLYLAKSLATFKKTFLSTTPIQHFQFVSCSIVDDNSSGSLVFTANSASISCSSNSSVANHGDRVKRYKFFGNKVCNVLGLPENYWIYADKFRLPTSGSDSNYISGDILANSINIRDNFAISNAASIESDLPLHHHRDTDRWVKWTDMSGSIPSNDMMIGYSNLNDRYEIRMKNHNLLISSSATTASGDFLTTGTLSGSISASSISSTGNIDVKHTLPRINLQSNTLDAEAYLALTGGKLLLYNTYDSVGGDLEIRTKDFDNALFLDNSTTQLGIGTLSPSAKLDINGNLQVQSHITASKKLLAFDDIELRDGAIGGDTLVKIYDSNDDGVIDVNNNGITVHRLDASQSGTSFINTPFAIGTGTSYPNSDVSIAGDISSSGNVHIEGDITASGDIVFNTKNQDTMTERGIYFNDTAGVKGFIRGFSGTGGEIEIGSDNIIQFTETDGDTEHIRFDMNSGKVGIGTTSPQNNNALLTVAGHISSSGGVRLDNPSTSAYAQQAIIKWSVFTGVTGAKDSTTAVTHGVTNGKKRIVGIQFNVVSDENNAGSMVSGDMIVAGSGYSQDIDERPHISFDDTTIHIYISDDGDAIHDSRFTMLVHYANADLY